MSIYAKKSNRQRALTAVLDGEYGKKKVEKPLEKQKTGVPKHWWKSLAPQGKDRVWARFLSKAEWEATSELFRYPTLRLVIQELKNLITDLGGWEESVLWSKELKPVLFDLKNYYNTARKERDEIKKEKRISDTSMPVHQLAKINKTDRRVICRIRKFLILSFIGSGKFLSIGDNEFWTAVERGKAIRTLSKKQNRSRTEKEKNPIMPTIKEQSLITCSSTLERAAAMSFEKRVTPDVPLSRHENGLEPVEKIDRLEQAVILDAKLETIGNLKIDTLNVYLDFAFTLPAKEFNGRTVKEVADIFGLSLEKSDLRAFLCATNMRPRKQKAIRSFPAPVKLVDSFSYMRTEANDDMPMYYESSEYWSNRNAFEGIRKNSMASSSEMKRLIQAIGAIA